MSEFDSHADIPFQLKIEGEKITVKWQPGVPTKSTPGVANSGQGTISWNIPSPARGCATIADGTSAYCGVIVLVSNFPLGPTEQPTDGVIYDADPSVDSSTHAGDMIGNALVVGAFYEGELKANGEEMTTSLIVNDVDANTPYYIAVHAVDCQFRYHKQGAAAYSREYAKDGTADTPGSQVIELGSGVELSDSLPAGKFCIPGSPLQNTTYKFDILITDSYPEVTKDQLYPISIESSEICTYSDLIFNIRKQLIAQTINRSKISVPVDASVWTNPEPFIPPEVFTPDIISQPPNTGQYCVESNIVKQYDGVTFNVVDDVLYELEDPNKVAAGEYWWDPDNEVMRIAVAGSPLGSPAGSPIPTTWSEVEVIKYIEDPRQLTDCDDYWYNGVNAYKWCATTWCQQTLITSNTDPSLAPTYDCSFFWFQTGSPGQLFEYKSNTQTFEETFAIMWPEDPNNLSAGTYWFDSTNSELFVRSASPQTWTPISESSPIEVVISETEPTSPAVGLLWYQPSVETLSQFDGSNFVDVPVLVWPEDPTLRDSCDKWWQTGISPEIFYVWDSVNNEWDQATFVQQAENPFTPPTIALDTLWYNPSNDTLSRYNGVAFESVTFMNETLDPTMPADGTIWYNPATEEFFVAASGSPLWIEIDPIQTTTDPNLIADGAIWFDTDDQMLYTRSNGQWVITPYEVSCSLPEKGALWYDETEGTLKEWDGTNWIPSYQLPVDIMLNEDGHLEFTTQGLGSRNVVMVVVPDGVASGQALIHGYGCRPQFGTLSTHSFAFYGPDSCPLNLLTLQECAALASGVTSNNWLFGTNGLNIALVKPQIHGFDGLSNTPSYLELGVGTDGTSDERRALSNWIREQLGYPVIDVELTKEQLDNSIRRALDVFRQKSGRAYKRGFYFLDVKPGVQEYTLTSKIVGYNKIVNVMGAYRFTSAFLSSAHGAGVYGQVVLQHLYNMGTYDLTSYHLISQYVEQLEHLFATRLTFYFDEQDRKFRLYTAFVREERILLECSVDKTEQEIFVDRWAKNWIERWALSEAMLVLARIRGKFASLPGAGGGVSLDAADLMTRAVEERQALEQEIDDYLANDPESYGQGSTFLIG